MLPVTRYGLADFVASQRYLAPALTYLLIVVVYDTSGGGGLLGTYALTAGVLFPIGAWMTVAVMRTEDPTQRLVTLATVGSVTRVRLGKLLAALVATLGLAGVAVFLPVAIPHQGLTAGNVLAGIVAHILTALLGLALGGLCSPPVVRRTGYGLLAITMVVVALTATKIPPFFSLLKVLGADHATDLFFKLAQLSGITVLVTLAAIGVGLRLTRART